MCTSLARLRIVGINDVYELKNLPKLAHFISSQHPSPTAVVLAGDFLSPSILSSFDGGRGMVATLRAAGITHCCFGNHEADLKLDSLRERISDLSKSIHVINSNMRNPPPKASWMISPLTSPYSLISTPCRRAHIALLGMISDEPTIFRDGTFKGVSISNVIDTYQSFHEKLIPNTADLIISVTHQSMARDQELAQHIAATTGNGLIIGGHEHIAHDQLVSRGGSQVRILKAGSDATHANLIDLHIDTSSKPAKIMKIDQELCDLRDGPSITTVARIAKSHTTVIENMNNQTIADAGYLLPIGVPLSSKRTRFEQTTVGSFFCQCIKEELEVDVAIINGGSIKGGVDYHRNRMSYAELRNELPFPVKMVVVTMTREELQSAIRFSRTNIESGSLEMDGEVERRGYIQVDIDYNMDNSHLSDNNERLKVALPRNLMNGFCSIEPLMCLGEALKQQDKFPARDDFIPAKELIVRHCCKTRWFELMQEKGSFDEFDLNHDGVLDRNEIKAMLAKNLRREIPDFVVDDMIKSIDSDNSGVINAGEFSYLMAVTERQLTKRNDF